MTYLLELKQYCDGRGVWSKRDDTPYDRYHTAYCATIGLMSFSFLSRTSHGSLELLYPVPRAFRVRAIDCSLKGGSLAAVYIHYILCRYYVPRFVPAWALEPQ